MKNEGEFEDKETNRQMDICDCRVAFTTDKYSNNILIMSNTFTFSNVLVVEIIFSNCCWVKKTRGINNALNKPFEESCGIRQ